MGVHGGVVRCEAFKLGDARGARHVSAGPRHCVQHEQPWCAGHRRPAHTLPLTLVQMASLLQTGTDKANFGMQSLAYSCVQHLKRGSVHVRDSGRRVCPAGRQLCTTGSTALPPTIRRLRAAHQAECVLPRSLASDLTTRPSTARQMSGRIISIAARRNTTEASGGSSPSRRQTGDEPARNSVATIAPTHTIPSSDTGRIHEPSVHL